MLRHGENQRTGATGWQNRSSASAREQFGQGIEHDLRPGFKILPPSEQFLARGEAEVRNRFFASPDIVVLQIHQMYDTQMHAPDLRRVIIDQGHRPLGKSPAEPKLLADFALNRVVVGGLVQVKKALVGIVDVPADADRGFGDESLLAGLRATRVVQDFSPVEEDRIRDDLFQRGIVLRRRSRSEKIILL